MSMNIFIFGTRNAVVKVKGKRKQIKDTTNFNEWQTPTAVTKAILAAGNTDSMVKAYIDWVLTQGVDEIEPVFAEDDIFCEGDPIGTRVFNTAVEHVERFREWLAMCEAEDFTVKFEMM